MRPLFAFVMMASDRQRLCLNKRKAMNQFVAASDYQRWDFADSDWNRLALSTEQLDPCSCLTAWQLSFHDCFSPNRLLLLRQEGESMIAFAEEAHWFDFPVLAPVESHWFFGNPLLGERPLALLVDTLGQLQIHRGFRYPGIFISGIWQQSPLLTNLQNFQALRYEAVQFKSEIQCFASLAGGVDGYLSRRSRKWRQNLRQQQNRARRAGIEFERHQPVSSKQAQEIFGRMLTVERQSWKGIEQCGMAESPAHEFYLRMLQRLAMSGDARVIFARHGGDDIGFVFGGIGGDFYRGQQFSFIDQWKKYSIGNLLQMQQIQWLCEQSVRRYDMGPLMPYKLNWAEQQTAMDSWLLRLR